MVVFVFENAKIAGREVRVELERGTCATVRSRRVVGAERALRCGWTVRECHALKLFSTNGHHEADFESLDATRRPRDRETNLRVRLGGSLFRARAPRRPSRARLFPSHHPGFLRRVARNLLQRDGDVQLARRRPPSVSGTTWSCVHGSPSAIAPASGPNQSRPYPMGSSFVRVSSSMTRNARCSRPRMAGSDTTSGRRGTCLSHRHAGFKSDVIVSVRHRDGRPGLPAGGGPSAGPKNTTYGSEDRPKSDAMSWFPRSIENRNCHSENCVGSYRSGRETRRKALPKQRAFRAARLERLGVRQRRHRLRGRARVRGRERRGHGVFFAASAVRVLVVDFRAVDGDVHGGRVDSLRSRASRRIRTFDVIFEVYDSGVREEFELQRRGDGFVIARADVSCGGEHRLLGDESLRRAPQHAVAPRRRALFLVLEPSLTLHLERRHVCARGVSPRTRGRRPRASSRR